jgi:Sec-independent protein translocase protein TatA
MDEITRAATYESINVDWCHPLVTFLAESNVDHGAGQLQLFILIVFAILFLLLSQLRELMRQIAHTAEEWRRMRRSIRRDAEDPLADLQQPNDWPDHHYGDDLDAH